MLGNWVEIVMEIRQSISMSFCLNSTEMRERDNQGNCRERKEKVVIMGWQWKELRGIM